MSVLVKPLITEKMSYLTEKREQYGFVVKPKASKPEIKAAIEAMYGVEVERINTLIVAGKRKSRFTKSGVINGKKSNFKKAIVQLKEGQSIDFYSNI